MIVVSTKVLEMLCHPERKPSRKLKAKDLVAKGPFSGEMEIYTMDEFLELGCDKPAKRRKTEKGK